MIRRNGTAQWLVIGFILLAGLAVNAQVAVKVILNHNNFMLYEPILAQVTLRNYSGHPLIFGKNKKLAGKIQFEILGPSGELVQIKNGEGPKIEGILINPGKQQNIIVELSQFYSLYKAGRYSLRAYISHPQLKDSYQSSQISFTISKGITIWDHIVGVPDVNNNNKSKDGNIEKRKYNITTMYDGTKNFYYLIVEDDDNIYSVRRIGREMSQYKPECKIDRLSRLHILLATTPRVYAYYIFDHNGKLEHESVYRKSDSTPTLVRNDESGSVTLVGGVHATKGVDYDQAPVNPFEDPNKYKPKEHKSLFNITGRPDDV